MIRPPARADTPRCRAREVLSAAQCAAERGPPSALCAAWAWDPRLRLTAPGPARWGAGHETLTQPPSAAAVMQLGHGLVHAAFALGLASLAEPVPEVGFLLQCAGIGGVIGRLIALYRRGRDSQVDAWMITTAWSGLAVVLGVVVLAITVVA